MSAPNQQIRFRQRNRTYYADLERVHQLLVPPGQRVLEIGCGLGTDATNFARAGAEYTGLELSEVSLGLAKKRFDVFGLDGTFVHANAEQLTQHVRKASFDLIYSFGVIHHESSLPLSKYELSVS